MKVINGIECEECLAPELVRFATGDVVEGVLLQREKIAVGGKPVLRYMVEKPNGLCVTFLGTADIIQKLKPGHVGCFISVTCIGENTMIKKGDNYMKVFEIFASLQPISKLAAANGNGSAPGDGTEITDEDIPF